MDTSDILKLKVDIDAREILTADARAGHGDLVEGLDLLAWRAGLGGRLLCRGRQGKCGEQRKRQAMDIRNSAYGHGQLPGDG